MSILGFIIVINHLSYSQNKELIFEKNSDKFSLYFGNHYQIFDKNNINVINEYSSNAYRLPWGERKYWKVEMKNKEVIYITNLLMSELDIMKHFELSKIQRNEKFYPIIK